MKKIKKKLLIIFSLILMVFCILMSFVNKYTYRKIKLNVKPDGIFSSQYSNKLAVIIDGKLFLYDEDGNQEKIDTDFKVKYAHLLDDSVWVIDDNGNLYEITFKVSDIVLTDVCYINSNSKSFTAITNSGDLYVWGDNTNHCLGIKNREFIEEPTKVEYITHVKKTAMSYKTTILLTEEGKVFQSGLIQTGYSDSTYWHEFNELKFDVSIDDVFEGLYCINLNDNRIFDWSQLIIGKDKIILNNFETVSVFCQQQNIFYFSKGMGFTLGLTSQGDVFYWGSDFLSTSRADDYVMPPAKIPYINDVDMIYTAKKVAYLQKGNDIYIIKPGYTFDDFINEHLYLFY